MEDEEEDRNIKTMSATAKASATGTASISYTSGLLKRQLDFAKNSRDGAGEIEALFENSHGKISQEKKREHHQNVMSAVVNSIAFLEGQKHWFRERLEEGRWEFENEKKIEDEVEWRRHLEDAFVKIIEIVNQRESKILEGSKPYNEVKALRKFRNTLIHFKPVLSKAEENYTDHEKYRHNVEEILKDRNFPEDELGNGNIYPFNWLSYEMAERSVRMSFTVWRFFGRELDKEDEFLEGIPSP